MRKHQAAYLILITSLTFGIGCDKHQDGQAQTSLPTKQSPRLTRKTDQLQEIIAVGTEFKWSFIDPGPDRQEGTEDDFRYGNTLRLPAEQNVDLQLRSTDYVYTLNVPDGRVQAVIPDLDRSIRFQVPKEGRHVFQTDPMCGLRYFHDDVLGVLEVLPEKSP